MIILFLSLSLPLSLSQVQDMVNKIDDGSGVLDFEDFLLVTIIDLRTSVLIYEGDFR